MGFFFPDSKNKISKSEFKELRGHLSGNDFSHDEIDKIESIFNADLNEERENDSGIDEWEMKRSLEWMRSHLDEHHISEKKIEILERKMKEFL
ncbi:MAG: hypothetical protein WCC74_00715 [Minisyncoccia bacterium]